MYSQLQGLGSQTQLEARFEARGHARTYNARDSRNGKPVQETLMTRIRNRFHHPENASRTEPSEVEVRQSITDMIDMVLHP